MVRIVFFAALLALSLSGALPSVHAKSAVSTPSQKKVSMPISGSSQHGMESFERDFCDFLRSWCVPGASIAVSKGGKLVYSRGFGWADFENKRKVEPHSLFRIASISKSLTAVAALKLCEEGKLRLDEKVFDILNDFDAMRAPNRDRRMDDITVRDLLYCTAGWNPKVSGDPLFAPNITQIAAEHGESVPPKLHTIINWWLKRPLDFSPGTSWGYSNFVYEVLGAVIAKRAGEPYGSYVKSHVLSPSAMIDTHLGKTVEQFAHEVRYYPYPGQSTTESIYSGIKEQVHYQYGGDFDLPTMAASAGWISSTIDLVRFVNAVQKNSAAKPSQTKPVISDASFLRMVSKSPSPYWKDKKGYFAMGWEVYPTTSGSGYTFSRVGTMPGSMSFVVRRYDDTCWAVLFNSRPEDQDRFMGEAKVMIWKAINKQKNWN